MPDLIHIQELELSAHIGVPEGEREQAQRLTVNLTLEPLTDFQNLRDSIENTVDYYILSRAVQELARAHPRKLIETLATEIAGRLLERFALRSVEVELRKYILPDSDYVSVRVRRHV